MFSGWKKPLLAKLERRKISLLASYARHFQRVMGCFPTGASRLGTSPARAWRTG